MTVMNPLRHVAQSTRIHAWHGSRSYSTLPRVATPSFWHSLIPKPFRHSTPTTPSQQTKPVAVAKPWNPATFFIVIFLLIGSNSVNLIAVKKDYISFSRQADARIATLKEAIERVQRGEDVDVKKLLGTGDPVAEKEWEEVIKELEMERRPEDTKRARRAAKRKEKKNKDIEQNIGAGNSVDKFAAQEENWTQSTSERNQGRKAEFY